MTKIELAKIKQKAGRWIEERRFEMIETSLSIHKHPELPLKEYFASRLLGRKLNEGGFTVQRGVAGLKTAFVGHLKGRRQRPHLALFAEYDALPTLGHACGHNLIGTSSIYAGLALAHLKLPLPGTLSIFGTPAEEAFGGKIKMLEEGVFRGVEAGLMFHPGEKTVVDSRYGAGQVIRLEFFGKAADPNTEMGTGVDALDALIQTFNAIYALNKMLYTKGNIAGVILKGGEISNVTPEYTIGQFEVVSRTKKQVEEIVERVKDCAKGAALSAKARYKFSFPEPLYQPLLINHILAGTLKKNLGGLNVKVDPGVHDQLDYLDLGNISQKIPTALLEVSIGKDIPDHSAEFAKAAKSKKAQEALMITTKTLTSSLLDLFFEPHLLEKVEKEFKESRKKTKPTAAV